MSGFSGASRRIRRPITAVTAVAGLAVSGTVLTGGAALAALVGGRIDVVTYPDGDQSWVSIAYECVPGGNDLTPNQKSVLGPQRTPFGAGSHRFRIGESAVRTEVYRTPDYDGKPLADISRLQYSTYAKQTDGSGPDRQAPYFRINVLSDSTDPSNPRDSLFFFPSNNQDQHAIVNGEWQSWDVAHGVLNVGYDTGPNGQTATTLHDYVLAHPHAVLFNNDGGLADGGAIATIVGCAMGGTADPYVNGTYYVDRVIVGNQGQDTLYDFESSRRDEAGTKSTLVTVNPDHLRGFAHSAYNANTNADLTSDQRFVTGPANPPAGVGSLRFAIRKVANRVEQFRTAKYDGRLLRDLRGLSYWTYQRPTGTNTSPQQPVYVRINVDLNGDGIFQGGATGPDEQLYFSPANNSNQQGVAQSTWQRWNVFRGKFTINGDPGTGGPLFTLKNYLVQHPDATIVNNQPAGGAQSGGVDFQVGASGNNQRNGKYYLDDINIRFVDAATSTMVSGKRYDLEP